MIFVVGCARPSGGAPTAATDPAPENEAAPAPVPAPAAPAPMPATASASAPAAVHAGDAIAELEVEGDLPVYVVRGARPAPPAVFLTGSCTTPLGYVQAFRRAAAEHSGIVALQGDKPCPEGGRRWSADALATSARIDAALHAAGFTDTSDVTLVGYSQGAERAEWLAHRFPAKYTRFVLIAGPVVPSPYRLEDARAVVTLAGYGDVRENMAGGARRLRRGDVPAAYMELPASTKHGELAPGADETLSRAFDWLEANAQDPDDLDAATARASTRAPAPLPRAARAHARAARPPYVDPRRSHGAERSSRASRGS